MGVFYFGDGNKFLGIGEIGELTFDEEIPEYVKDIRYPLSDKAELTCEVEVNAPLFARAVGGVDIAQLNGDCTSFTIEGKVPRQVQVRRHKKKRINKKWAKRYGFKTIFETIRLTNVEFNREDDTIGFEIPAL